MVVIVVLAVFAPPIVLLWLAGLVRPSWTRWICALAMLLTAFFAIAAVLDGEIRFQYICFAAAGLALTMRYCFGPSRVRTKI